LKTILNITGALFIMAGVLLLAFCYMVSDPEIEGDSGRTPLSSYLISLIPILFGILLLIISNNNRKKKISN
jgi:hypothetical protein